MAQKIRIYEAQAILEEGMQIVNIPTVDIPLNHYWKDGKMTMPFLVPEEFEMENIPIFVTKNDGILEVPDGYNARYFGTFVNGNDSYHVFFFKQVISPT